MAIDTYTGSGTAIFTVPDQCTVLSGDVYGAGGGGASAGSGGRISGTIPVTPGQQLEIRRGGAGSALPAGAGGYNGGGAGGIAPGSGGGSSGGGTGGGGWSAIIDVATNTILLLAAGGGGEGRNPISGALGGDGGAATGASGAAGTVGAGAGAGGGPSAGGAGGATGTGLSGTAVAGTALQGGRGSNHVTANAYGGGGGGGGWQGGGGGGGSLNGRSGGGGGGSNHAHASVTVGVNQRGWGASPHPGEDGLIVLQYNVPPSAAAPVSPANNANIDASQPLPLQWLGGDSDASRTAEGVTASDVRWRVGTGAWTTTNVADSSGTHDFAQTLAVAAHTFDSFIGQTVEWQARTYDLAGAVGPYSASAYFIPRAAPAAPTIDPAFTAPGLFVTTTPVVPFTTGNTMIAFQLRAVADASGSADPTRVIGDTGLLNTSPVTENAGRVPYPTPAAIRLGALVYVVGDPYHFQVRYQHDTGLWSPWADSGPMLAQINAPLAPSASILVNAANAAIVLTISNPGSDPHPPVHNDVYRQDVTRESPETRVATGIGINATWTDWQPPLNVSLAYRVVAVAANGSETSS